MSRIVSQPVDTQFEVQCPTCDFTLLTVRPGGEEADEVHGQTYFLTDGDTLFLGDRIPEDRRTQAWDASFMAGDCPGCGARFVVYDVAMILNPKASGDCKSECFQHLLMNRPTVDRQVFRCTAEGIEGLEVKPWIVERSITPFGVMDRHSFAPMPLSSLDPVHTVNGISACGANGSEAISDGVALVSRLFPALWAHNVEAQPSVT